MCLVDKKQFRCSETKIPIWKVVDIRDKSFRSPYQGTRLHRVNQITEVNEFDSQMCNFPDPSVLVGFGKALYKFDTGFYHAFRNKELAEVVLQNMLMSSSNNCKLVIVDGYIPEGTRYAIDIDGVSICARKMILNI